MKALERTYDPDRYLCTWSVPDGTGGWRSLSGSVDARANRPPQGNAYGDVPLRNDSSAPGQFAAAFPQRTELPALRARLASGGTLILMDAAMEYGIQGDGYIRGSAALLGKGGVSLGRATGVEPSEQLEPRVTSARFQISALDAVLGAPPILLDPSAFDVPKGQWTAHTNLGAGVEWESGGVKLRVGYDSKMRVMDWYEFGLRFSPVVDLDFTDGVTLRELVDNFVEPLRRIISIATGRTRDLTHLTVKLDGEKGWFQVFEQRITQEPFESSQKEVRDTPTALRAHEDGVSLLDLITSWRDLKSEHHPLVETYGSMLHATDQHPRSRFLLLIQALEGMHGSETREQYAERAAKHAESRAAVLEKLKAMATGGDPAEEPPSEALSADDRRFIKKFLTKRPLSSLDSALVMMIKALPVNGMDALAGTRLVKGVLASGRAESTPGALRTVRNDLAHGNRGYLDCELNEVVAVLERTVRGHALRLLGCSDTVVTRVFDED